MKITQKIIINKPANEVWKIIAHDFDLAYQWMGPVPHSYDINKGKHSNGAPMEGRICHLSNNPNGAKAKEIITQYNEQAKALTFEVTSIDVPAIVPVKKNVVEISVINKAANQSEVIWVSRPQLKLLAYPFYPLLRFMIPIAFSKLLKGLKTFSEELSSNKNVTKEA